MSRFALPLALVAAASVSSCALAAPIAVGAPAPDFTLRDQNNKPHRLADARGKWVVLAFYPKDNTRGCTLQNQSYSQEAAKFAARKAVVYTLSAQDVASKKDFCAQAKLSHTLLSDPGAKTAQSYGVRMPIGMAQRVTFYIDPQGKIAHVDSKPSVARAAQDSLQTLDKLARK